ncbi:hypothetical protein BDR26DRAFT_859310 [Obelidium mucronatum]|nr:hypothetical protein BDR26DRAFT_859310 [Obelidium mucronatum]
MASTTLKELQRMITNLKQQQRQACSSSEVCDSVYDGGSEGSSSGSPTTTDMDDDANLPVSLLMDLVRSVFRHFDSSLAGATDDTNTTTNTHSDTTTKKTHLRNSIRQVEQFQRANPGLVLSAQEVLDVLEKVVAASVVRSLLSQNTCADADEKEKEKKKENEKEDAKSEHEKEKENRCRSPPPRRLTPSHVSFRSPIAALPLALLGGGGAETAVEMDDDDADADVFFTPASTPSAKHAPFRQRKHAVVSPSPASASTRKSAIPRRVLSASTTQPVLQHPSSASTPASHKPSQLSKSISAASPSSPSPSPFAFPSSTTTATTDTTASSETENYFSSNPLFSSSSSSSSSSSDSCRESSTSDLPTGAGSDNDTVRNGFPGIDAEGPPFSLSSCAADDDVAFSLEGNGSLDKDGKLLRFPVEEKQELQSTISSLQKRLQEAKKGYEQSATSHEHRIILLQEEVERLKKSVGGGRSARGSISGGSISSLYGFGLHGRRREGIEELEYLEEENAKLAKELSDSRGLNTKLKAQLDRRNEANGKLREELDQTLIVCGGLEYRIDVFEKEMKKKTDESSALASIVTRLQADVNTSVQVIESLTEENRDLVAAKESLDANLKEIMELMHVEQEDDEKREENEDHDDFSFSSAKHDRSRSLHYELSNSILHETHLEETPSFLQTLSKCATTRPNSTQTDSPSNTTTSTQSIPLFEFRKSQGTCTLTIETTSTAVQSVAKTRDAACLYSPTFASVHIGVQTVRHEVVEASCQSMDPPSYTSVDVQTVGVGKRETSVETDVVLSVDLSVQTETRGLVDTGAVDLFVGVERVGRQEIDVQTEGPGVCMSDETVDLFVGVERVERVSGGMQTEAGVGSAGAAVQTEAPVNVSEAFGVCMVESQVETMVSGNDVAAMVEAVKRVKELESVIEKMEGDLEGVWSVEVEGWVSCCELLKSEVKELQMAILENRRKLNLRKHYDEEVERWIDELKNQVLNVEEVIGPAREALENRQTLDDTLVHRVQALLELKGEYEESIRRLEDARLADHEKHHQQMFDMSLVTLNSQVINDPIPAEEWSDEEEEHQQDVREKSAARHAKARNARKSNTTTQQQKLPMSTLFNGEKIAAYVILPLLAMSYLSLSITSTRGNLDGVIATSSDAYLLQQRGAAPGRPSSSMTPLFNSGGISGEAGPGLVERVDQAMVVVEGAVRRVVGWGSSSQVSDEFGQREASSQRPRIM